MQYDNVHKEQTEQPTHYDIIDQLLFEAEKKVLRIIGDNATPHLRVFKDIEHHLMPNDKHLIQQFASTAETSVHNLLNKESLNLMEEKRTTFTEVESLANQKTNLYEETNNLNTNPLDETNNLNTNPLEETNNLNTNPHEDTNNYFTDIFEETNNEKKNPEEANNSFTDIIDEKMNDSSRTIIKEKTVPNFDKLYEDVLNTAISKVSELDLNNSVKSTLTPVLEHNFDMETNNPPITKNADPHKGVLNTAISKVSELDLNNSVKSALTPVLEHNFDMETNNPPITKIANSLTGEIDDLLTNEAAYPLTDESDDLLTDKNDADITSHTTDKIYDIVINTAISKILDLGLNNTDKMLKKSYNETEKTHQSIFDESKDRNKLHHNDATITLYEINYDDTSKNKIVNNTTLTIDPNDKTKFIVS